MNKSNEKNCEKLLVIHQSENPTTDYYICPLLNLLESKYDVVNLQKIKTIGFENYDSIIVIRYLTKLLVKKLDSLENKRLIYFMDDDLFDKSAHLGLPVFYQYKLNKYAFRFRKWIEKNAEIWVSSLHLEKKYSFLDPTLLYPQKIDYRSREINICYHSTGSHFNEVVWLFDIIAKLHQEDKNINFEIFGDRAVKKLYKKLDRVNVLDQMSWSEYKNYLCTQKRDLALIPLLPSEFNAARSYVKAFEVESLGAIGIFADTYKEIMPSSEIQNNFKFLPMDKGIWIKDLQEIISKIRLERTQVA